MAFNAQHIGAWQSGTAKDNKPHIGAWQGELEPPAINTVNYVSISGCIYQDNELGFEPVTISGGSRAENTATGGTTQAANGSLPAMNGVLTMKTAYHRSIGGSL